MGRKKLFSYALDNGEGSKTVGIVKAKDIEGAVRFVQDAYNMDDYASARVRTVEFDSNGDDLYCEIEVDERLERERLEKLLSDSGH